ncbi:MAG: hypothetical protein HUJ27_14915 [Rhodobacteraceae bacterium]|nr:hypothetical protein [Paracoccaceae bacterium]
MSRFHLAFLTVLLVALQNQTSPAQAQAPGPDAFAAYMDGAAELAEALDRTQFDIEALSFELAVEDPEAIAARVDALVATQIYRGALRGAEGTLRAGAGNSLDQALLLHRLLIDAGQEARIARATLSEEEAQRLILSASAPERPAPLADAEAGAAALARMELATGSPGLLDPLSDLLNGRLEAPEAPETVVAEARRISEALGDAMPDGSALDAVLLEEAREYFWVQTRLFGGDPWKDLHIAFAPSDLPTPDSYVSLPLHDDLKHWVEIAFQLEIRDQDKLKLQDLMQSFWVSAADLSARPIVVSILPDGILKDPEIGTVDATKQTTFYFPLLNGELPPGALAFTREGLTAPAGDVLESGGMASIIATGAAQVSAAGGMLQSLGGGGGADDLPANTPMRDVTGLWARITIQAPGGERKTIWRPMFDRIGADRRAEDSVYVPEGAPAAEIAVLGQWMVMIMTGGTGPAELVATQIERAQQMAPMIMAGDTEMNGLPTSNPAMHSLMTGMFDIAAQAGSASSGGWTYRAAPQVLITSQTYTREGENTLQRSGIDIVETGRRAVGEDGKALPIGALGAGVAETIAERAMADAIAVNGGRPPISTSGSWDILSTTDSLVPVRGESDIPEQLPGTRAAMEAELKLGRILALADGDNAAWWRIDPLSGAAIGVDRFGGGAESADYLSLVDAIVTGVFTGYGASQCEGSGAAYACCVGANFAWGLIGFGVLFKASEGIVALNMADAYMAGAIGFGTGVGVSASQWNPVQDLACGK